MKKPETVRCKVCGKNAGYLCDTHNEHSRTEILHHYRCVECGLVFVGNQIDNEELGVAYSTLDNESYYEEIKNENLKKMKGAVRDLVNLTSKESKIIDIGTGNGQFIEILFAYGFKKVAAHEIPGSDLSKIETLGCTIYRDFGYKIIPSNSFDVVTLLDVAEHVPNPRYLFQTCNRILREGGIIYFHTPVVTKFDRMMHYLQRVPMFKKIGTIWQRARTSIFHLQNYTSQSLIKLLNEFGFDNISVVTRNELTWPVSRYIRIFLLEKQKLPGSLAPMLTPFFYPVLATDLFNPNKAIVWAKKGIKYCSKPKNYPKKARS